MHRLLASQPRFHLALAACAGGIAVYVAGALARSPGVDLPRHVALFLISFAFYLCAVLLILARRGRSSLSGWVLGAALSWAILLRIALLFTTPSLSDDVFRYVWDGKVINAGISPYAYPPSAPELSHLRGPLWNGVNHKEMHTPYPPLAEGLFAAAYRLVPDSLSAMQAMALVFDLGVIALLMLLLGRAGMDRSRVLIYAWNPLMMVQFVHSGHFDAAMLLPLLGAIYLLSLGRRAASGVSMGLAVLVKLVPALVTPLFLTLWGIAGLLAITATAGLGMAPILGSPGLAGTLTEASEARFNDSIGYLLVRVFGLLTDDPESSARLVSSATLVLSVCMLAVYLWKSGASWKQALRGTYSLLGLYLLMNAVVEPWYLTWLVPFLCFTLAAGRNGLPDLSPSWGWLLLSGLVMLTDLTYVPGAAGSTWVWVRAVEYGPVYLLLALWIWRHREQFLPRRAVLSDPEA